MIHDGSSAQMKEVDGEEKLMDERDKSDVENKRAKITGCYL